MEAFKLSVDVTEKRKMILDLPQSIPLGKAEVMVIIQPLTNGRERRGEIDLASRGITPEQAAEMRNRVISFEEDWNAPGMEVYDEL
jgi:hypothetical protein